MTFQLLYSSDAVSDLDEAAVDELIETSKRNNASKGVSGLLIYMNRCFLQLLEGEETAVRALYEKISRDPRHAEPFVYHEQHASRKAYGSWMTGYRQPSLENPSESQATRKQTARALHAITNNKPLWLRSAILMFTSAHLEIGELYHRAQIKP